MRRAIKDDVGAIGLRLMLVNDLAGLLPALTLSFARTALYRLAGVHIGERSRIFGRIEFSGMPAHPERLHIGSDTMINVHFFADLNAEIFIGDHVSIGHHVTFVTADHEVGTAVCRAGVLRPRPIVIGDGCWIGARTTVLPGVCIGHSSVVAAGSLVSHNVPPNRMVGGVPARALPPEP